MNIIGQIDQSAFAAAQRLHHREDELTLEFPSGAGSRSRGLLALRAQNWRAGGAPKPPWDYQVEYLSNGLAAKYIGSQVAFPYIDLGYLPSTSLGIEAEFSVDLISSTDSMICGSFKASGQGYFGAYIYGYRDFKMWGGATQMQPYGLGERIKVQSNLFADGWYRTFNSDGSARGSSQLTGTPSFGTENVWLFSCSRGSYNSYAVGLIKCWGCRLTNGDALVRDLVPCVKDGIPCMYDMVSRSFMYSASSYQFVAGPRI